MNRLSYASIRFKLIALSVVISSIMVGCMILIFPAKTTSFGMTLMRRDARYVTSLLADNLALGIQAAVFDDGASLRQSLESLKIDAGEDKVIGSVLVLDAERGFVSGVNCRAGDGDDIPEHLDGIGLDESAHCLTAYAPLRADDTIVGYLRIEFDKGYVIANSRSFLMFALVTGAITLLLSLAIGVLVNRSVTGQLFEVIRGLTTSAGNVRQASQSMSRASNGMADGANRQAATLQEIANSLGDVTSSTEQTATSAGTANENSASACEIVKKGQDAMMRMAAAMTRISESTNETSRIIGTIDEIAFQTNLLALNAAVEAARAGEAGRGFAVVADEVRSLAQRSAQSARDTADLIEVSRSSSENGVNVASEVGTMLEEIVRSIGSVSTLIGEVAHASSEQAASVNRINAGIHNVEAVTGANANSAKESAAAAAQLSNEASGTYRLVEKLVKVVNGQGSESDIAEVCGKAYRPSLPAGGEVGAVLASRGSGRGHG